jgi:hypothetical protein
VEIERVVKTSDGTLVAISGPGEDGLISVYKLCPEAVVSGCKLEDEGHNFVLSNESGEIVLTINNVKAVFFKKTEGTLFG